MDNHTHVGAFAIVKAPLVTAVYTRRGCPIHGETRRVDNFCPKCGRPVGLLRRFETHRARLSDLLPDDEALFAPWGVEGLDDDELIVIGNRGQTGAMPDGDIVEITGADIERCKTEFAHTYSAELAHIEKSATVTIKFGLVNYVL